PQGECRVRGRRRRGTALDASPPGERGRGRRALAEAAGDVAGVGRLHGADRPQIPGDDPGAARVVTGGTATELRTSPVHVPGSAARWTTSNVDEGLPGTLTPITWSFYFPPVELAARLGWYRLGAMSGRERPIPDDVDGRFFTAVLGHPATNL